MRHSLFAAAAAMLLATRAPALGFSQLKAGSSKTQFADFSTLESQEDGVLRGTFEQLIDHDDPSMGTFTQHFLYNAKYYQPGSPIVLMTPGEAPLEVYEAYTSNDYFLGALAERLKAAAILLEPRFYGNSSPYSLLTVENMTTLTVDQNLQDLTFFASVAELPFDQNRTSSTDKAPWILSGCLYSGALAAWVSAQYPYTFWAYHASSAMVESITDYWQYFDTIGKALSSNCSADWVRVVDYMDGVLLSSDENAKHQLKAKIGLATLEHDDDFAAMAMSPLAYWQAHRFSDGYNNISQMCDYIENRWPGSKSPQPSAKGVGTTKAFEGFAKWMTEIFFPQSCGDWQCWDTYNTTLPIIHDLSLSNELNRQSFWIQCHEAMEWLWDRGESKYMSRLVTRHYWQRQCGMIFPGVDFGSPSARKFNDRTGGWLGKFQPRMAWTAGELDPWRDATMMSDYRPGGPIRSMVDQTVQIVPGGSSCEDWHMIDAAANEGLQAVVNANLNALEGWVNEFYQNGGWPQTQN